MGTEFLVFVDLELTGGFSRRKVLVFAFENSLFGCVSYCLLGWVEFTWGVDIFFRREKHAARALLSLVSLVS